MSVTWGFLTHTYSTRCVSARRYSTSVTRSAVSASVSINRYTLFVSLHRRVSLVMVPGVSINRYTSACSHVGDENCNVVRGVNSGSLTVRAYFTLPCIWVRFGESVRAIVCAYESVYGFLCRLDALFVVCPVARVSSPPKGTCISLGRPI